MFRKALLAASIGALTITTAHASPLDGAAAYQAHVWNAAATDLQFMQQGIWTSGGSTFSKEGDQIRYKLMFTYLPTPISAGQTFTVDVVSATSGGRALYTFPSTLTCSLDFDNQPHQQFVGCSGTYTITADDIGHSIQPTITFRTSASASVQSRATMNAVAYVAPAFIEPEYTQIRLTCGMQSYAEVRSSSALSFVNPADEALLETDGYSIMLAGKTLTISGVGKSHSRTDRFIPLRNVEGITKNYSVIGVMPESAHAYGSVTPPTVNLNVSAGETVDISAALRAANASMNEFPSVASGFFSTVNETALSLADGVTPASYAASGRIVGTGTAFEGAGRQFSFEAPADAKSGIIEFQYNIAQRLEGPAGAGCDPWTRTAQGRLFMTVDGIDDPEPETPVDPGTPTAGAKFMFRYPTPPMMNLKS